MSTRPFALVCDVKSHAIEPYIIVSEHGSSDLGFETGKP